MPTRPLDPAIADLIRRDRAAGLTMRAIARRRGVSFGTVSNCCAGIAPGSAEPTESTLPTDTAPRPTVSLDAGAPSLPNLVGSPLPEAIPLSYEPFVIDTLGWVGVLCDPHLPYHDKRTIEAWASDCQSKNASVLLLNGDLLDCAQVSSHYREPNTPRLRDEIAAGKQFFAYLRERFPRARIVYKEGNHDFRVRSYLATRAPEIFDIPGISLPDLLGLKDYGVEYVADKRPIRVHKLNIYHGHEFRGSGGINPARWLYLRTNATAMCGHFHRASYHPERSADNKLYQCWSVGCACFLYPQYDPNNKWGLGYAMVNHHRDGFHVDNRQLLPDGRAV